MPACCSSFIKKALRRLGLCPPARRHLHPLRRHRRVERRAVKEAALRARAHRCVAIIEEPMAAAIGAGLPVAEPVGSMIVDIGGGTSEVAIISLGGIVTARSVRVAGDEFDSAIINYIKKKYNLLIGERTAENIKMGIGAAYKTGDTEPVMDIKGRNLLNGLPENITVTSEEIREAISEPLSHVIDAIKTTLEKTPPELAADIIESGIMLAGGGALAERARSAYPRGNRHARQDRGAPPRPRC